MSNERLFTVEHEFEGTEFTGTRDECQEYIANYGGGWMALKMREATKDEIELSKPPKP
jgi:hypothetical protein